MSSNPKPLAVGDRVKFKRRNGKDAKGRIVIRRETTRGLWFEVNTAPAGHPLEITCVRAGLLRRF